MRHIFQKASLIVLLLALSGCFTLRRDPKYLGPPERPDSVMNYYRPSGSYSNVQNSLVKEYEEFSRSRIVLQTPHGEAIIDYYKNHTLSDALILVFPVLGGKHSVIEHHFAQYFAQYGYDTAIVYQDQSIKKPENVDRLESLLRDMVIRDRIVLDYFEEQHGIKRFGTFGISRGAFNVAMSAGVESRFKFNIMALGASDIVDVFMNSTEGRIAKYRDRIMAERKMTREQFATFLTSMIKTDPKYLAQYLDADNTLLFLALFDDTVPITNGRGLRTIIGKPETTFLLAGHKTAILYTQIFPLIFPEGWGPEIFPIDYVETQSLAFYDRKFERPRIDGEHILFELLQLPFKMFDELIRSIF